VLLFLDRNNIIVTKNRLLELLTFRALFSATNAFLIFISNILLFTFTTNNRSFTQENIDNNDYNFLLYISYFESISKATNELVEIITKIESEIQLSFYNIEISENLNSKNVKKIDFVYFSRNCSILFNE